MTDKKEKKQQTRREVPEFFCSTDEHPCDGACGPLHRSYEGADGKPVPCPALMTIKDLSRKKQRRWK